MLASWLERILTIDPLWSAEERSSARLMGGILLALASVLSLITLVHLTLGDPAAIQTGVGLLACLGALLLLRRGYLELVRWSIPTVTFVIITALSASNLGVVDEAVYAFPILIALSGLLLGQRGVIVSTLVSIAAFESIGFLQARGMLPGAHYEVTTNRLIVVPLLFGLAGIVIATAIGNLLSSLKALHEKERLLEESNRELQQIRETLEEQVQERTQRAEQARQQAEEATQAMQTQVWLAVGQAELNERMRGELTLKALGNNIIRLLCNYLEAQVGALYVVEGSTYKLVAGYAFNPGERELDFTKGEGLLGQAVAERKVLSMTDLFPNELVVSSGLGSVAPRHVMVVPFEYNDEVIGVVEIGKLDAFLPEEQKFLAMVASSIAIACNAAKARVRMAELISQVQDNFMTQ